MFVFLVWFLIVLIVWFVCIFVRLIITFVVCIYVIAWFAFVVDLYCLLWFDIAGFPLLYGVVLFVGLLWVLACFERISCLLVGFSNLSNLLFGPLFCGFCVCGFVWVFR